MEGADKGEEKVERTRRTHEKPKNPRGTKAREGTRSREEGKDKHNHGVKESLVEGEGVKKVEDECSARADLRTRSCLISTAYFLSLLT